MFRFWKKNEMVKEQTPLEEIIKKQTPIEKFYLLVHPFYGMYSETQKDRMMEVWKESAYTSSREINTFAIVYFAGLPSDHDKPDDFEFYFDKPRASELELGRHVQQCFGRERSKFVLIHNIYPYIIWSYDERIKEKISDPDKITMTARGIYGDRCVLDALSAVSEAYHVPPENGKVVPEESLYSDKKIAKAHGVTENIIVNGGWMNPDFQKILAWGR